MSAVHTVLQPAHAVETTRLFCRIGVIPGSALELYRIFKG